MKVKGICGEHGLIEMIRGKAKLFSRDVAVGIGDDAAVLRYNKGSYLLFTTDSLIENIHFSLKYFKPEQIGMKAIEQNVSDIAAMGGIPRFALVSLALPKHIDAEFVDKLYNGINKKSKKYRISIVGGNITRSREVAVNAAMLGFAEKKCLALRNGAKIGDLVFCTGHVGESSVGLELLKRNKEGHSIKKHLEPESRLDLARKIVKIGISSMIDVSDGIAPEVRRICEESKVGAVIYADKMPISKGTISDSKRIKKNPLDFALYGGEDFELVFTANKNKLNQLKKYDVNVIGKIVGKKCGIKLIKGNKKMNLGKGFEHFSKLR